MPTRHQRLRCHARSSRTGKPCQAWAILGGTVCRTHGGSVKHVKEKARERLEAMILPALVTIRRIAESGETDAVSLAAAKDILDRVGLRPADLVQVDNTVHIRVSYADTGMAPPPGRSTDHVNGHALADGR